MIITIYMEQVVTWLASLLALIYIVFFGRKLLKWLLIKFYDLIFPHRDGRSDHQ
jgi:hypothetical protein